MTLLESVLVALGCPGRGATVDPAAAVRHRSPQVQYPKASLRRLGGFSARLRKIQNAVGPVAARNKVLKTFDALQTIIESVAERILERQDGVRRRAIFRCFPAGPASDTTRPLVAAGLELGCRSRPGSGSADQSGPRPLCAACRALQRYPARYPPSLRSS